MNYLAQMPTILITPPSAGFPDIGALVTTIINWGVSLAAVAALLYLLMGGFSYMTAGDDPKAMEAARGRLTNAIIGLVIVASVWGIFQIIVSIIPGLISVFGGG